MTNKTTPAGATREMLAIQLRAEEHKRTSFAHNLGWHQEVADALLETFEVRLRGTVPAEQISDANAKEEAITRAYNAVTGADDEGWHPDRTLAALNALWDEAREARNAAH